MNFAAKQELDSLAKEKVKWMIWKTLQLRQLSNSSTKCCRSQIPVGFFFWDKIPVGGSGMLCLMDMCCLVGTPAHELHSFCIARMYFFSSEYLVFSIPLKFRLFLRYHENSTLSLLRHYYHGNISGGNHNFYKNSCKPRQNSHLNLPKRSHM